MAVFPGQDFSTWVSDEGLPDLDPNFRIITGPRVVLEAVARRWIATRGSMDDPSYGAEVLTYLNASLTSGEFGVLQAALRAEALQVEGVDDAGVTVTLDPVTGQLTGTASITLADEETYDLAFVLTSDKIVRIYGLDEVG